MLDNYSMADPQQIRKLKPAFIKLQDKTQPPSQFSVNILNEINNQHKPPHEELQFSEIKPDPQPCPPDQKWKPSRIKSFKWIKQKQNSFRKKQKQTTIQRLSFETKLFKLEKQRPNKINCSMTSIFKFPSQQALISKQKAIPLISQEKEQYVVQICRMFKQNYTNIEQENTKGHIAFKQSQAEKLKNCQTQKSKSPPILGFNYDGSILTVTPPVKKIKNQSIECVGCQLEEEIIEPLLEYRNDSNKKIYTKPSEGGRFEKLEELRSGYIQNFERIKWNPKITVQCNSKFKASSFRKSRDMQGNIHDRKQDLHRGRANTLAGNKMVLDQKSKIKIHSSQAYEEHLLTKPVRINGNRSYIINNSQVKNNDQQFQFLEIQRSRSSKCQDERNNKAENKKILVFNNLLINDFQQCAKEKVHHKRCRSADIRSSNQIATSEKKGSADLKSGQKKEFKKKIIENKAQNFQNSRLKNEVKKHTRSKPTYDTLKQKWKN